MTNANVYLVSNKTLLGKEENVEITLCIKDNKTAAFTSYLYFDNTKLEYISGPENANLVDNCVIFVWYDLEGGNNLKEGELEKFEFKAKAEGIATFNIEGEFYDNTGEPINVSFEELEVQIVNENLIIPQNELENTNEANNIKIDDIELSNNNLETLAIENTLLNPVFNASQTNYKVEVSKDIIDLNIVAVPENENAKVEIVKHDKLQEGKNLIEIIVTAVDGISKKVYKIEVYRRNEQEEEVFIKNEKENEIKLKEIIEEEKISNELNISNKTEEVKNDINKAQSKQKNSSIWIILITVSVIFLIFIICIYKIKK